MDSKCLDFCEDSRLKSSLYIVVIIVLIGPSESHPVRLALQVDCGFNRRMMKKSCEICDPRFKIHTHTHLTNFMQTRLTISKIS
jgi:hypothetical protein